MTCYLSIKYVCNKSMVFCLSIFFPDTKAFVLKREMTTQLTSVPTGIYNIEMCVLYSF